MNKGTRTDILLLSLLIGAPIVLAVLCLLFPDAFYDGFVWKYYFGPIVADAGGETGDITSSYNWVDTLTYGVVLAISAYLIHRWFERADIRVGPLFFLSMLPIVIIGSSARVLEDMELFREPAQYLFISPVIYIFLGISTIASLAFALRVERLWPDGGRGFRTASFLFLLLPGLIISIFAVSFPEWTSERIMTWPILLSSLAGAFAFIGISRRPRWETLLFTFWTIVLSFVVYLYLLWMMEGDWYEGYMEISGELPQTRPLGGLAVIGLAMATTTIVLVLLRFPFIRKKRVGQLFSSINAMIIFGHMLDASATYVGIDHFGYIEKHVLPSTLIDLTGTALVMYPLKLGFLLPALYVTDVSMAKGTEKNGHLIALIKLTVLILGLAPGIRDLLRSSLGV